MPLCIQSATARVPTPLAVQYVSQGQKSLIGAADMLTRIPSFLKLCLLSYSYPSGRAYDAVTKYNQLT